MPIEQKENNFRCVLFSCCYPDSRLFPISSLWICCYDRIRIQPDFCYITNLRAQSIHSQNVKKHWDTNQMELGTCICTETYSCGRKGDGDLG